MTTIDPQHACDLYDLDEVGATEGPWTFVGTQDVRESRWHHVMWLVVRDDAGQHWGLEYRIGLTEDQPHELPWDDADGPLPLTRLYPHEVRKVEYRTKPQEAGALPRLTETGSAREVTGDA